MVHVRAKRKLVLVLATPVACARLSHRIDIASSVDCESGGERGCEAGLRAGRG